MPSITTIGLPIWICLTKTEKVENDTNKTEGFGDSEATFKNIPGDENTTLTTKGAQEIKIETKKELNSIHLIIKEYYKNKETVEYTIVYWPKDENAFFYKIKFSGRDAKTVAKYYLEALKKSEAFSVKIDNEEVPKNEYFNFLEKILEEEKKK